MSGDIAMLLAEGDRTSPHVERAIEKATTEGAVLHGVYVIEAWHFGEYSVYGWEELAREIHTEKSEALFEAIRDRCAANGIEFETAVTEGNPCESVQNYATAHDIDCVICREPDGSGRQTRAPSMINRLDQDPCATVETV